ncbi:MAG: hypothetical protein ABI237_07955 [Ginsengibacter sp.]
MSVKRNQPENFQTYFCTFTCLNWLHLFEISNLYDELYKWFNILIKKGNQIEGFVMMPNHVHLLLFVNKNENVNKLLANGKRFLAYEVIDRLELLQHHDILSQLSAAVTLKEKQRNKKHRVFEISSDIKACYTEEFLLQKLNYIHNNSVSGIWNLVAIPEDYFHSSAAFYTFNQHNALQGFRVDITGSIAHRPLRETILGSNQQHPLINITHYRDSGLILPDL